MAKRQMTEEEEQSLMLDISDVAPPPEPQTDIIEDDHKAMRGVPAVKLCFVGHGQGGGRIAQQFWQYGYRRICAINTALADIQPLELPSERKLTIGVGGGAGGDPLAGARITTQHAEDIYDLCRKSFGGTFDKVMVCATAGGGTGSGGVETIIDVSHQLLDKLEQRTLDRLDPQVGVILALPKESDGKAANMNAANTLQRLAAMATQDNPRISPLIVIDNQRIDKLYPRATTGQFWGLANHAVCSIFHLLNLVAGRESAYTSFDKSDFAAVIRSGFIVFGATPIKQWRDRQDIGVALRDNLQRNLLVGGTDLKSAKIASCVIVGNKKILDDELPQGYIDDGLSMLGRMIAANGTVKHGIYATKQEGLVSYTMIGGLAAPRDRIAELRKISGMRDHDGA